MEITAKLIQEIIGEAIEMFAHEVDATGIAAVELVEDGGLIVTLDDGSEFGITISKR